MNKSALVYKPSFSLLMMENDLPLSFHVKILWWVSYKWGSYEHKGAEGGEQYLKCISGPLPFFHVGMFNNLKITLAFKRVSVSQNTRYLVWGGYFRRLLPQFFPVSLCSLIHSLEHFLHWDHHVVLNMHVYLFIQQKFLSICYVSTQFWVNETSAVIKTKKECCPVEEARWRQTMIP